MIFYNNQLMKSPAQMRLFMVTNPVAFSRYEDHEAALYIQLHDLIEQAVSEGEDPVALLEDAFQMSYPEGPTTAELASFLFHTTEMTAALTLLKENWQSLDPDLPEDSLLYGGASQEEVAEIFSQTTLRAYLEALIALAYE